MRTQNGPQITHSMVCSIHAPSNGRIWWVPAKDLTLCQREVLEGQSPKRFDESSKAGTWSFEEKFISNVVSLDKDKTQENPPQYQCKISQLFVFCVLGLLSVASSSVFHPCLWFCSPNVATYRRPPGSAMATSLC